MLLKYKKIKLKIPGGGKLPVNWSSMPLNSCVPDNQLISQESLNLHDLSSKG